MCLLSNFFKTLKIQDLEPVSFLTVPSLSRMSALKEINIELEWLTDIDMLHDYSITGVMTRAIKYYAEVNNK